LPDYPEDMAWPDLARLLDPTTHLGELKTATPFELVAYVELMANEGPARLEPGLTPWWEVPTWVIEHRPDDCDAIDRTLSKAQHMRDLICLRDITGAQ
jgi:hypothetical protein